MWSWSYGFVAETGGREYRSRHIPSGVTNYFYAKSTGNTNLHRHLLKKHPEEYNKVIEDFDWPYKPSMHAEDASIHNANVTVQPVPPYSPQAFLDYLVHFIVSDDQVYPFILYSFTPSHIF